jgi:carbon storage regulator CsrA
VLVLGRRVGQRVLIGDDVVVTVLAIDGARVTLGFEAPRAVAVLRDEMKDPEPPDRGQCQVCGRDLEERIEGERHWLACPVCDPSDAHD